MSMTMTRPKALMLKGGSGEQQQDRKDGAMYSTRWSSRHKAPSLGISPDGTTAISPFEADWDPRNYNAELDEDELDNDVRKQGWSTRGEDPFPTEGRHYFEVTFEMTGLTQGCALLDGWNTIGLVSDAVSDWEGMWWDDRGGRSLHFYGLHDAQNHPFAHKSDPRADVQRWAKGGGFGHGDRIGIYVDMGARTASAFKNGVLLGTAFTDLPERVFPLVTVMSENTTATISFPPPPPDAYIASAEPPKVFGAPGTPGFEYGSCKIPGHAERGCSGLCDAKAVLEPAEYERLFGEEDRLVAEYTRELRVKTGQAAMQEGIRLLKRVGAAKRNNSQPEAVIEVAEGLHEAVYAAPNHAKLVVSEGTHKWQKQKTSLWVDAELEKNPKAEVWTVDELIRTWHWYDAIVFPKECGNRVEGAGRGSTVLWGRWRMMNRTQGSFARATLLAEPPINEDCTIEAWGRWAWEDCNLRSAGGSVLQVSRTGDVEVNGCWLGGDGELARRARRGIEVFMTAKAAVRESTVSHVGFYERACALLATHQGGLEVEGTSFVEVDQCLRVEWEANVTMSGCSVHEVSVACFECPPKAKWFKAHIKEIEEWKAQGRSEPYAEPYFGKEYEQNLRNRSALVLKDTKVYLNQLGEGFVWRTDHRPRVYEEQNVTYVHHPDHMPPPNVKDFDEFMDGEEVEKWARRFSEDTPELLEEIKAMMREARQEALEESIEMCKAS